MLLLSAGCGHGGSSGESSLALALQPGEEAIAQRLIAAAEASWDDFDGLARARLVRLAAAQKCPCPGVAGALADCARPRGEGCLRAPFAARAILRGLSRGDSDESIATGLLERFGPREPEQIDLGAAPCRGNPGAPVTLVVFSDFECPHCSRANELVTKVEQLVGPRLRVCFKHWPLESIHPRAELAARATVAAQLQERFWPMHDRLFAHQSELERQELVGHARALGLDWERFERDIDSDEVARRVAGDAAEARRLRLTGTPSFLVNGRNVTGPISVAELLDWIAEALALAKEGGGSGGEGRL